MREAARLKGIFESAHHGILADEIAEIGRPVFPRQNLIFDLVRNFRIRGIYRVAHTTTRFGVIIRKIRWEPEHATRNINSLRLLPSGPDRVGERFVRGRPPAEIIAVLGGEVASSIHKSAHKIDPGLLFNDKGTHHALNRTTAQRRIIEIGGK